MLLLARDVQVCGAREAKENWHALPRKAVRGAKKGTVDFWYGKPSGRSDVGVPRQRAAGPWGIGEKRLMLQHRVVDLW